MKNPERLARQIIAVTESMDYVLADGDARIAMVVKLLSPKERCPGCAELVAGWCAEYRGFFGRDYLPEPLDMEAARRLLKDRAANEVISLAKAAWKFRDDRKRTPCAHSLSIAGLQAHLPEIEKAITQ